MAVAPVPDADAEQRERTRQGRILADARRQVDVANARVADLESQVGNLASRLDERDKAEHAAYLAALPEDERLRVELDEANSKIAALAAKVDKPAETPRAQPTAAAPLSDDQIRQKKRELADEANKAYGLTGDYQIDPEDPALDSSGSRAFVGSLRTLGTMLKGAQERAGGGAPAAPTTTAGQEQPAVAKTHAPTEAEIEEMVQRRVSKVLGLSGALSPEAAGAAAAGTGVAPTTEDFQNTMRGYSSKMGPKATIAQLQKQRGDAQKAVASAGG